MITKNVENTVVLPYLEGIDTNIHSHSFLYPDHVLPYLEGIDTKCSGSKPRLLRILCFTVPRRN